ncbi:MAG: polymerase, sigma-24 subunit, subfamily [Verrucomicrobia bacterium]|nr:polymerase, sigma-24 subunit, subfamily [Verrucomicrobiota bacterium]
MPPKESTFSTAVPVAPCEAAIAGGDHARWFSEEVHAHDQQLKAWLRGNFPAVRDVDDVVQESYLRIWKTKARQPIRFAKAFLFRVARHLALDLLRRNRISPVESGYDFDLSSVLDTGPDAVEALLNDELFNHVIESLLILPAREREVIVLHKLKGLPHREVAAQLNLTEGTAQKYCSIGMSRCAEHLKSKGITGFFS